jgi:TPR repeat protein
MFEGYAIKRDVARSAQSFLKGARRGNLAALSGFSRMYFGEESVELMEFSAQKGDRHQYNMRLLGLYYMQGKIVKPDYLKSARYYMIVADEGSIERAWQATGFYYRGYLMERDLDKAEYWAGKVLQSSGTRNIFYREQAELLLERIHRAKSSARLKTELLPDRRNRRGFALNHLFGHGSKPIK